ncbi:MAG: pyridoxal phosphate-dependent aminotransferase [Muribaculaceae bacterium]|nr:pyridoxal phosphate-dependent aminotransferase [Muribaculaceae bacterium]
MRKYDFDSVIDRHGSGAVKYDDLQQTFGSEDLIPLWIADMDFAVCPDITEALRERMSHPIFGYASPSPGYWDSIIAWLDRRHGFKVGRQDITYIPGVVKGIGFAINFFTRPGDKVVIQPPVYHPFKRVVEGNDRIVVNNPLIKTADSYRMDTEGLEELVRREHPRMMILCNPHNPIGLQWSEETLREVARIARENDMIVVSDEIHGDLMLDCRRHIPFLAVGEDARAVGVMLGAPSKTFNIPGMVSSWCIIKNPELRLPFYNWLETNEFDAPTFTATIATEAAYEHGEPWLEEALTYISENIDFTERYVAERLPKLAIVRPEASFLVWLDCRGLGLSQEQLVRMFVNRAHLALNDGAMFGDEGVGYMRLNVACPREVLKTALDHLADALS